MWIAFEVFQSQSYDDIFYQSNTYCSLQKLMLLKSHKSILSQLIKSNENNFMSV